MFLIFCMMIEVNIVVYLAQVPDFKKIIQGLAGY